MINTNDSPATPRFSVYGPIHKGIRHALATSLLRLSTTSFPDDAALGAVLDDVEGVLFFCERHLEHEETFIRPMLVRGGLSVLAPIDSAHGEHTAAVAELRSLCATLRAAPASQRAALGRLLVLHYSAFVGDAFVHMAEEEQVVEPMLLRTFPEAEIVAMHEALVASIPPDEMVTSLRYIVAGSSAEERAQLLGGAPPEARASMLEAVRPVLPAADWDELAARLAA